MSLAKRRHDLIPNLVAAVKGHSGYEKGTLESVVDLRGVPIRHYRVADDAPGAVVPAPQTAHRPRAHRQNPQYASVTAIEFPIPSRHSGPAHPGAAIGGLGVAAD